MEEDPFFISIRFSIEQQKFDNYPATDIFGGIFMPKVVF